MSTVVSSFSAALEAGSIAAAALDILGISLNVLEIFYQAFLCKNTDF